MSSSLCDLIIPKGTVYFGAKVHKKSYLSLQRVMCVSHNTDKYTGVITESRDGKYQAFTSLVFHTFNRHYIKREDRAAVMLVIYVQ